MYHSSTCPGTSLHVTQFYQAFPRISTAATNTGVRRPGYEAMLHVCNGTLLHSWGGKKLFHVMFEHSGRRMKILTVLLNCHRILTQTYIMLTLGVELGLICLLRVAITNLDRPRQYVMCATCASIWTRLSVTWEQV